MFCNHEINTTSWKDPKNSFEIHTYDKSNFWMMKEFAFFFVSIMLKTFDAKAR